VNIWVENGPDSGPEAVQRRAGVKLLKTLISETELALAQAAQDGADTAQLGRELTALKSSKSYYDNEFTGKEKYWWMLFQPQ